MHASRGPPHRADSTSAPAPADPVGVFPTRFPSMKTALASVAVAAVLGLGFYLAGQPLDVADYVIILLGTTLLVWTYEQYGKGKEQL